MLFKVCSASGNVRKFVKADSMLDLKEKACGVLSINKILHVVTEKEGIEVEEDEVLMELKGEVLMMLAEGDSWEDKSKKQMVAPLPQEQIESTSCQIMPALPGTSNNEKATASQPDFLEGQSQPSVFSSKVTKNFTVPLPSFSSGLTDDLKNGKILQCFTNLISECAHFYMNVYPIQESMQYKQIGEQLYLKYPCIRFPTGAEPWTTFCEKLSQKIRNTRWVMKRKSMMPESTPKCKMPRAASHSASIASSAISQEDYEHHLQEIKLEMDKPKPNNTQIQMLIKATHTNRRQWMTTLEAGAVELILKAFPCFTDIEHILYEFRIIRGKDNIDEEVKNVEQLFRLAAKSMTKKPQGTDTEKEIALIKYLEEMTAFNKGKGVKSSTILKIKQDVSETDIDGCCLTKEKTPLQLMAFLNEESILQEAVIVGDGVSIFCKTGKLLDALLYLLVSYYVMDLEYPRQFSQLMGILQHFVIKDRFDGKVSSKFSKFCTYLDKEWKS